MRELRQDEATYLKLPAWAWSVISEALAMDTESSNISIELREEISRGLEAVEHLSLIARRKVNLQAGDSFDIIPDTGKVTIKKKRKRRSVKMVPGRQA